MNQTPQKITGEITFSQKTYQEIQDKVKNISGFEKIIEEFLNKPITELLEIILGGGINIEASDIHLEPQKENAKIRIRIDGLLQDVLVFELEIYQKLLSRIKLASGLKLNVNDKPQDGRFSAILEEKQKKTAIEIRTSTIPAEYGESIVLRILNPKTIIEIEKLGLRKEILNIVAKEIKKPNGMIIVTGPTGSGKSTTLYAFLKKIQKPEIKIITIEDPIEYHIKEISQTQINPKKGYDFAIGLKSIMRQDPDIILVGEVRDPETGQTAIQAALTGHLVLTTLHTNEAVGTIARLTNLKVKPSDIGPAVNLIIAQRLVRKVCKKCSELKNISPLDFKKIKNHLSLLSETLNYPVLKKLSPKTKLPQVKSCPLCNFTGYRGRIGIFEMFLVDDEIEKFILSSPSIAKLKEKVIKEGMITMYQDGLLKVLEGITTIEEVERVSLP